MDEIEFPQSVCINSQPHGPHRIAGTWRTECPGLEEEVRGVPNEPNMVGVNPAADPAWVAERDRAGVMTVAEADAYYAALESQRTWKPRLPEISGRWAGATDEERLVLVERAHAEASIENRARFNIDQDKRRLDLAQDQALNEDATRNSPRTLTTAALADVAKVWRTINAPQGFRPVDVRPLLDRIERALRAGRSEPLYTPAAGDADQYNEWGQPTGYVHPSAG